MPGGDGDGDRPSGERRLPRPVPWIALAVTLLVALVWKAQCADEQVWDAQRQHELLCYSDPVALWFTRGFSGGAVPYLDEPFEYPPLIGLQVWALASISRLVHGGVGWFFALNALVHAAFAGGILALLERLHLPSRRRLWWAAAPPLLLYAFLNWDLPALFLLLLAVVLHLGGRDLAAGAAAGLGASAKLFPLLVVPIALLARLRHREVRRAGSHLAGAALAWSLVNLPLGLLAPEGWRFFFEAHSERGPTGGTIWALLARVGLLEADPVVVNPASAALFALGSAGIVLTGLRRLPPASTWRLVLPVLAWLLLSNKVLSPQFDLWLVPLIAVAGAGWMLSWFVAADLMVFLTEFAHLGGELGTGPLMLATSFRALVLVAIVGGWLRHPLQGWSGHRQESSHILPSSTSSAIGRPYQIGEK